MNAPCRNLPIVPSSRGFFGFPIQCAGSTTPLKRTSAGERFMMGMIVGAGLMSFAFKYHVMYAKDGLVLIPKKQASLSDPYVDVRSWKFSDWQAHPDLVQSLMANGRSDLISGPATDLLHDLQRKMDKAEKPDDDSRIE
jgi:hypothetical protein